MSVQEYLFASSQANCDGFYPGCQLDDSNPLTWPPSDNLQLASETLFLSNCVTIDRMQPDWGIQDDMVVVDRPVQLDSVQLDSDAPLEHPSPATANKSDWLLRGDASVNQTFDQPLQTNSHIAVNPNETNMLFYHVPVTGFSGVETFTDTFNTNVSQTITAEVATASGASNTLDITNLPPEIFEANPGLSNAVANDGRNDSAAMQAAINWVKTQPSTNSTQKNTIYIPVGTFDLAETINVNTDNVVFQGAGSGRTVLQNANQFQVGTSGLPDGEIVVESINRDAYLFDLNQEADSVSFQNMTLTGPDIHGAIFSNRSEGLVITNVEFNDFLWSSVRLFGVRDARIHDNVFIDAGGQANGNKGVTGGSIFATYLKDSQIYNNAISESGNYQREVYGIKGREFKNTRIYNNSISANFAIELPFEHDSFVEIDHNYLDGVVSIPRLSGGTVPEDGYTFHIHHNYFTRSYALEWSRNGVEVNHNVFIFDAEKDNGNLMSNFDSTASQGPTKFHNNLILNPGRGLVWHKGVYNNFSFYNNEVIANETATPRTDGLFGFNPKTDFSTVEIRDNLITLNGRERPLMRNNASYGAVIENNQLVNISDIDKFNNPSTGNQRGLLQPLLFQVGVDDEFTVDGLDISLTTDRTNTPLTATDIEARFKLQH